VPRSTAWRGACRVEVRVDPARDATGAGRGLDGVAAEHTANAEIERRVAGRRHNLWLCLASRGEPGGDARALGGTC
jgi:hypothetical protein